MDVSSQPEKCWKIKMLSSDYEDAIIHILVQPNNSTINELPVASKVKKYRSTEFFFCFSLQSEALQMLAVPANDLPTKPSNMLDDTFCTSE